MKYQEFKSLLLKANTEEDVKAAFSKYYHIDYDTSAYHDLYTTNLLFEFKFERNLEKIGNRALVLAQSLYYIHRLKYEAIGKPIPRYICLADKQTAIITETLNWRIYYENERYDWEAPPSKPDKQLVEDLEKESTIRVTHVFNLLSKQDNDAFSQRILQYLNPQLEIDYQIRKDINEENFEDVFEHWKEIIGKQIKNGYKLSNYFLANIQTDKVSIQEELSRVTFIFEDGNAKVQKILMRDYNYFWEMYDYVKSINKIQGINAKLDRLTEETQRRFEGEFFTPIRFAKRAVHLWEKVLGKHWFKSGKYRIWDMAAGTGNLEYHLPSEAYKYLYMSTLHATDVDYLQKIFPMATIFQYDYLNDDVPNLFGNLPYEPKWKLPEQLRQDLADTEITWIVYINPPFATAQTAGAKGESKKGVSKTAVNSVMESLNVGHVKRELFAQFMFRIHKEFPKNTYLGMFSKLKYLNAPDSIKFRDQFFNYRFVDGFTFYSKNFHGVKGKYPIGFLIWDLSAQREKDQISMTILNDSAFPVGKKQLRLLKKGQYLNDWVERPSNSNDYILPPLSNAITVKHENVDTRHRARKDFLASLCSNGNDFQHAKYVVLLSSPNASAGAFTVNKSNFEKALVLHAVKKIPQHTWLNDRNQFLYPTQEPDQGFILDCIIWSLFANSNETASLSNVEYKVATYQIQNHFFPFTRATLKNWNILDPDVLLQLDRDQDRFMAKYLKDQNFSDEANALLLAGKSIYKFFFENLHKLETHSLKITNWDAGWYQIRRCLTLNEVGANELAAVKKAHSILSDSIFVRIKEFGFLDTDELYDSVDGV